MNLRAGYLFNMSVHNVTIVFSNQDDFRWMLSFPISQRPKYGGR
jgi:hypothetical protein